MTNRRNRTVGRATAPILQHSIITGAAALGAAASLMPGAAQANTYTVTNTTDSGAGSLRQAVIDANSHAGADTILFNSSLSGQTITLSSQIALYDTTTVQGLGASNLTISGNDNNRVFYVHNTGSVIDVTISSLTLTNGYYDGSGGAIFSTGVNLTLQDATVQNSYVSFYGGGVAAVDGGDDVTIAINNSTIRNNTSDGGGGGLYLSSGSGTVTVSNSTISGNVANSNGGGGAYLSLLNSRGTILVEHSSVTGNSTGSASIDSCGGGLYLTGGTTNLVDTQVSNNYSSGAGGGTSAFQTNFIIDQSRVTGNTSNRVGGGLYSDKASFTMTNTTVSDNTAAVAGGGLYITNFYYAGTGTGGVSIAGSTINNNSAGNAGGISLQSSSASTGSDAIFTNDTVFGNSASGIGGGLYAKNLYASTLTVESSTIVGNSATGAGGGVVIDSNINNTVVLHDNIIANNTDDGTSPDAGGAFTANYNFIKDATGASLTGGNNTSGVDPMLGPLANNGGLTQTLRPLNDSPVIDAGDPAFTPPPSTDQRGAGFARVIGGTIDLGSLEFGNNAAAATAPTPLLGNAGRVLLGGLLAILALLGLRRRRNTGMLLLLLGMALVMQSPLIHAAGQKFHAHKARSAPTLVLGTIAAIDTNGDTVSVRLSDGNVLTAPLSNLRITDRRAAARGKSASATLATLKSGELAIIMLRNGKYAGMKVFLYDTQARAESALRRKQHIHAAR